MYLWELLAITGNMVWALVVTILSLYAGSQLWELMDQRYLESLDHVAGDETPLTWDKAMRNFFVSILAGFAAIISGVSLGSTAEKTIAWFDKYDDKTDDEACSDRDDCSNTKLNDGDSASNDLIAHLISVFYG